MKLICIKKHTQRENDASFIKFQGKDNEGNSIGVLPICLPWGDDDPGCNKKSTNKLTLAGWGYTSSNYTYNKQTVRNVFHRA